MDALRDAPEIQKQAPSTLVPRPHEDDLPKLHHALHYASLGIPILPLHYVTPVGTCSCGKPKGDPKCKPGKHPLGRLVPHGLTDATTDEVTIRRWFDGEPYNVGICTGTRSGFFALDRDDRDNGDQSLADLEAKHSALPPTLTQRTGNGVHYLFKMPTGREVRNSAKKLPPVWIFAVRAATS